MARLVDADEHAVDRRPLAGAECHGGVAAWLGVAVVFNRSGEREIGGYHHMLNIEHAIRGGHPPAAAAIDRGNPRVLENAATRRLPPGCQSHEGFCRIEPGLIRK